MTIDPTQIQLNPDQQAYIARQAERTGQPWAELLKQFVPTAPSFGQEESALDVATRLGLVGVCDGDPPDLATNPTHMKDFGKHGIRTSPG